MKTMETKRPIRTMKAIRIIKNLLAPALTLALVLPAAGSAQAVWDAPSFMRAGSPTGLTLALTDASPGEGLGVLALWRGAAAPTGLGFRAGISEAPGDDVVGLFGVDVSGSLSGAMGAGGPEALWWTGAGVGLGDDVSASFPLGIVFGWTARDSGVSFMPYVGGHVVLDVMAGEGDNMDLEGVVDLGVDLAFSTGWMVRFSASLGGRDALGIGMRVPR